MAENVPTHQDLENVQARMDRKLHEKLDEIAAELKGVHSQTRLTNGRMTAAEDRLARHAAALFGDQEMGFDGLITLMQNAMESAQQAERQTEQTNTRVDKLTKTMAGVALAFSAATIGLFFNLLQQGAISVVALPNF